MTCFDSTKYTCNVCGAECEGPPFFAREATQCASCGSSMRVRALAALLSQEIFGIPMSLPEFPRLKGLRGLGMSDSPALASRLAEKFDYTNTFYHQAPLLDVTSPDERDFGRYDFIISSEVMEHVPPPVEGAFATLGRLLKPDGVLLLTTPYTLGGKTAEHFPELHEYALAQVGGKTVLVNRRRDGSIEVFDKLVFHGGPGSTLEMRVFSEGSLRELLGSAGFSAIHIASEILPEFGIEHAESWSLPIAARKGRFTPFSAEFSREYRDLSRRAARALAGWELERAALQSEYAKLERELVERTEWARSLEHDWEERTAWALDLRREKTEAIAHLEQAQASEREAWQCVAALEKELDETRSKLADIRGRLWTRLGRKLGRLP